MLEDLHLLAKLNVKTYECYEEEPGVKLTMLYTIKKIRPSCIKKIIQTCAAAKPNASDRILIKKIGSSPPIMTFTRSDGINLEDNFIYLGIQKAIRTGDPSYRKWVSDKPCAKEQRKRVRVEEPVAEEAHNEEMPVAGEGRVVEEAPMAAPAREAGAVLNEDAQPPSLLVIAVEKWGQETAALKEQNALLKMELRGLKEVLASYRETIETKSALIETLQQSCKESKSIADHFERLVDYPI